MNIPFPASLFFSADRRFAQNPPREPDPFRSRRNATRPSRAQAEMWRRRYA